MPREISLAPAPDPTTVRYVRPCRRSDELMTDVPPLAVAPRRAETRRGTSTVRPTDPAAPGRPCALRTASARRASAYDSSTSARARSARRPSVSSPNLNKYIAPLPLHRRADRVAEAPDGGGGYGGARSYGSIRHRGPRRSTSSSSGVVTSRASRLMGGIAWQRRSSGCHAAGQCASISAWHSIRAWRMACAWHAAFSNVKAPPPHRGFTAAAPSQSRRPCPCGSRTASGSRRRGHRSQASARPPRRRPRIA